MNTDDGRTEMPTNVEIPPLGESVTEAVLLRWIKNDGEAVKKDEPLAELETDKANVDLPSPGAGVLRHGKKAGDTVKVGETIAGIDENGTPTAASAAAKPAPVAAAPTANPPSAQPASVAPAAKPEDFSPAVRRLVEENRLDPS